MKVHFTSHLEMFFPKLKSLDMNADYLDELLHKINQLFPGIIDYILEENGEIRLHVNIFLDQEIIINKKNIHLSLKDVKEVFIMQSLSGG